MEEEILLHGDTTPRKMQIELVAGDLAKSLRGDSEIGHNDSQIGA